MKQLIKLLFLYKFISVNSNNSNNSNNKFITFVNHLTKNTIMIDDKPEVLAHFDSSIHRFLFNDESRHRLSQTIEKIKNITK